jgi:hypothetical protein
MKWAAGSERQAVGSIQLVSQNPVSSLDLDLDVDVDGLVPGILSGHDIYQIALYLGLLTSNSTSRSKSRSTIPG